MTAFQICWLIGGTIIGYLAPELLLVIQPRLKIPLSFNLGTAFIGGLVAYTIVR